MSAEASFAVAAALAPCGLYCLRVARRRNPDYVPLALVPLFFSIQQCCEGFVWLGYQTPGALGFLFFAIAFWPIWIPWSMYCISRRLEALAFVAWGLGWLVLFVLLTGHPIQVSVVNHSLKYEVGLADDPFMRVVYLLNVVVPVFFTKDRFLWAMGGAAVVTAIITHVFLSYAFISLWCFFAAVISLSLCYLFYQMDHAAPADHF
jgi:hypothetical protein